MVQLPPAHRWSRQTSQQELPACPGLMWPWLQLGTQVSLTAVFAKPIATGGSKTHMSLLPAVSSDAHLAELAAAEIAPPITQEPSGQCWAMLDQLQAALMQRLACHRRPRVWGSQALGVTQPTKAGSPASTHASALHARPGGGCRAGGLCRRWTGRRCR